MPDTWRDALLRPLAMAAPDGGVYIETMAPDFRFMFVLSLLAILPALLLLKRHRPELPLRPVTLLLAITALAFVPWLMTTGNGRYFMVFLLAVGPLCLALVHLMPATRGFRLAAGACLIAVQAFAVYQSDSIRQWGLLPWKEAPYFKVELPEDMRTRPGTYVTMSSISYALIAPQLHPDSSWLSVTTLTTDRHKTAVGRRAHVLLSKAMPQLIVPVIPEHATAESLPDGEAIRGINLLLEPHALAVDQPPNCRLLPSESLASSPAFQQARATGNATVAGFWACPLRYPVAVSRPKISQTRFDAVFRKVETICPRFFRPGEASTQAIHGGEMREYFEADMKVYVMDDEVVLYRYKRSISPSRIGTVAEVMGGKARVDCSNIRGRSGLPWEREL
ncbi:hypothetical protein [Ramlibacter tataouinensis]|uniref:hypothetical protein n=1 Tax=Ramlibacter tataouinensis TaxID=94132 RepID=UPI0011AE4F30|nr:hypothetical protein [Ramlibacter tataouinensis]